jgi:Protein of unknown function (DUF1997)
MIHLTGSTQRSFIFPAERATAFAYYSDINRICPFLSHISVVRNYSPGQYRLLYSAVEMGFYRVRIFCDIIMTLDTRGNRLLISPLQGFPPVRTINSLYSIDCQGVFSSESIFCAAGDQTRVDYRINIQARFPAPVAIRIMPEHLLTNMAQNIMQWRIDEIVEGFIDRSTRTFSSQPGNYTFST